MKKTLFPTFLLLMVGFLFTAAPALSAKPRKPLKSNADQLSEREKTSRVTSAVNDKIRTLPLLFEENRGQFDKDIKFLSRVKNFNLALKSDEAVYQIPDARCEAGRRLLDATPGLREANDRMVPDEGETPCIARAEGDAFKLPAADIDEAEFAGA